MPWRECGVHQQGQAVRLEGRAAITQGKGRHERVSCSLSILERICWRLLNNVLKEGAGEMCPVKIQTEMVGDRSGRGRDARFGD